MVTPEQCRAARGLLDWSQQDLASEAGIGIVTVRQIEAGAVEPRRATLVVVRQALEKAGVEFIDENGGGPGVRLRQNPQSHRSRPGKTPPDAAKTATLWIDGVGHGYLTLEEAVIARNDLPADQRQRATIKVGGIEYGPSEIDRLRYK